jgi:hypothetical protein
VRLVSLGLLVSAIAAAPPAPSNPALVEFELVDQFGNRHSDDEYRSGVFVVVASDRKGSAFAPSWSRAIRGSLQGLPDADQVKMAGLAHLEGVPRLLRGLVKRAFPRRPEDWVLLDWGGVFEAAYGHEKDHTSLLVFADGNLVHRAYGQEVEPSEVAAIRSTIEAALEGTGPREAGARDLADGGE